MERFDVAVIGAGLLGCFAARALAAYDVSAAVLEAREDVCTGVSRANTGIIYTGCDTKPGTLKTALCVRANRAFGDLCRALDVRFSRCGSLMLARGPRAEGVLRRKKEQGTENGVPGLRLLPPAEVRALEPAAAEGVTLGLLAPGTGTVNPWELGVAAYENAAANGAAFRFGREVLAMRREGPGFVLETARETYAARAVINCAGLRADRVRELTQPPACRIFPTAADYLVLDEGTAELVRHVIFCEPETKGKGLTLVPTVDGNLLIGPTERPWTGGPAGAADRAGLERLAELCREAAPALPLGETIRGFAGLRPNPFAVTATAEGWIPERRSISDFTVLEEAGLISLLGIKTPGLTCAAPLGEHAAALALGYLGNPGPNPRFCPERKAPPAVRGMEAAARAALAAAEPDYGRIVCRCREVSLGELREAIRRGAVTVDGVKRRTGAGTGRCQGGRCLRGVLEALAEARGIPPWEVTKDGPGSPVLSAEGEEARHGAL